MAEETKKQICVGLLAHVDAGKTTLSEGMLYCSGSIRKLGRVDHRDAFLDTEAQEKARGITIFAKQAVLNLNHTRITLLDTPGHVDFSAEAERTLQVLDAAVLVVSGSDGVQGHTQTLWRLLRRHHIPTFLFVNKMDLDGTDRACLMAELHRQLSAVCVDFSSGQDYDAFAEQLALCEDAWMERYLSGGTFSESDLAGAISREKLFPVYFGSALKLQGVQEFLDGLERYTIQPDYPNRFGAMVYKISRDELGNRLTHMKITGGCLRVKTPLTGWDDPGGQPWQEKADQLRIYSGARYQAVEQASAGSICAVTGLTRTWPGEGLGVQLSGTDPELKPVLSCQLLPGTSDVQGDFLKLKQLEEEDPQLHLVWDERLREIHLRLMGEVQLEVLRTLIRERFGLEAEFGPGSILYQETISAPVEGIGHFEPLRHYAEVHLLIEPGAPGSGVVLDTACPEDSLARNWQRLILTHLEETTHLGVLAGMPLTDVKITLIGGRAHPKHTEGGDFRQATYRAVRQGLMKARRQGTAVLLEPWYEFRLELPADCVGRAMADIQQMGGSFQPPAQQQETATLRGRCPVAAMEGYSRQVTAYTHGRGQLVCLPGGYAPCRQTEAVLAAIGYQPEADVDHPADSVFCSHGAGYVVPWDQVDSHAHLGCLLRQPGVPEEPAPAGRPTRRPQTATDEELQAIFDNARYIPKRRELPPLAARSAASTVPEYRWQQPAPEYLLVDGYNMIFAWDDLSAIARDSLHSARDALIHILANYQGYTKKNVILVFDAYRVPGDNREIERHGGLWVVYTKEAETADSYIERVTYEIGKKYRVQVATSDGAEQSIILGNGALRMSAPMLRTEVTRVEGEIAEILSRHQA